MPNFNRLIIAGHLTRDPETMEFKSGRTLCKFGIACNRKWRSKDGQDGEETLFVDCVLFGPGGETFAKYMSKGRAVLLEGRLQLDQWTNDKGEKRSKHNMVVENFTFLGQTPRADAGLPDDEPAKAGWQPKGGEAVPDDEIPF